VEPFKMLLEDRMKVANVNWSPAEVEPFVSELHNDLNNPLENVTGKLHLEK